MEITKLFNLTQEQEDVLQYAISYYSLLHQTDVCLYPIDDITKPTTLEIFYYPHKDNYFIEFNFDDLYSCLTHTLKKPDFNLVKCFTINIYTQETND